MSVRLESAFYVVVKLGLVADVLLLERVWYRRRLRPQVVLMFTWDTFGLTGAFRGGRIDSGCTWPASSVCAVACLVVDVRRFCVAPPSPPWWPR